MSTPREIDIDLVEAYLARNSLDYLMGFNISPVLWQRLKGGIKSAGRVQSPTLRLVVDREMEIEKFVSEEFWSITSNFKLLDDSEFESNLFFYNNSKVEKFTLKNKASASNAVETLRGEKYHVEKVESQNRKRNPFAPFTTSTMQQTASNTLKVSPRDVMSTAQKLYEAGLITYMRTDGIEMAQEGINGARAQIAKMLGENFVPDKPMFYQNKAKNAQEAHECIRPTDFDKIPDTLKKLTKDELNLYSLIWKRALASQTKPAEILQTTITICSSCKNHKFRTSGQVIIFEGHLKIYKDQKKR
jgi:DNA topoisomerase-1